MQILAVIPARYQSQRLPGKPLARMGDRPDSPTLVQCVYEAAKSYAAFSRVIVATESAKIATCVRDFGGEVELTSNTHETGTDRIAEVAARHPEYDVVVNVQGDQPFVHPHMLNQLVAPYLTEKALPDMTTLACPLDLDNDIENPNVAKVICDRHSNALYFSRAPIPYFRQPRAAPVYRHLGLYAFRADFLATYTQLKSTPLEQCERLEQLRVLEHGYRIRVCQTETATIEINTPEDLAAAQAFIKEKLHTMSAMPTRPQGPYDNRPPV
ncbi:MAG: 3-deoxy-manno-octulosonate cytidylyltransferase [Cyanobacteria bacterium P01_D01_bin.105]